jgi:acyl-CoA hydrolase
MPTMMTMDAAIDALKTAAPEGGRVFIPGCAGEPLAFAAALAERPDAAAGLTFEGVWIPGVNRTDWAGLHDDARAEAIFLAPEWRDSFAVRRLAFSPLTYTQVWRRLSERAFDAGVFTVAPPGADGRCSLSVAADFSPAVFERTRFRIGLIHVGIPVVRDGPTVPLDAFDVVVEVDAPLPGYGAGTIDPVSAAIAARVASLIPDNATVQTGLGKIGVATLAALSDRRGLRVHSGMVTEPLIELLDRDAVEAVSTGVALGSSALYARVADDPRVRFRPVGETHAISTLAAIPRFVAVNSAIEVDLFGQVNAEWMDGRQVSGAGGLIDFLRGAWASDGGVPIVALPASAKGDALSRIVPRLSCPPSVGRGDPVVVVTEHGVADLRGLSIDARAQALIAVASPAHRAALADDWSAMRRAM